MSDIAEMAIAVVIIGILMGVGMLAVIGMHTCIDLIKNKMKEIKNDKNKLC